MKLENTMDFRWQALRKNTDQLVDGAKDQLGGIALVLAVVWAAFALDVLLSFLGVKLAEDWLALRPRQLTGIPGIVTMPLAHASFWHLAGNTIGLVFALIALALLRPRSWHRVLFAIYLASGVLTWLAGSLGSGTPIIGASAVVMGLVTFLLAPLLFLVGWWGWNRYRKTSEPFPIEIPLIPLAVSVVAAVFYFDNLFFGLMPIPSMTAGLNSTSFSAHWCGAISGLAVAFYFLKQEAA